MFCFPLSPMTNTHIRHDQIAFVNPPRILTWKVAGGVTVYPQPFWKIFSGISYHLWEAWADIMLSIKNRAFLNRCIHVILPLYLLNLVLYFVFQWMMKFSGHAREIVPSKLDMQIVWCVFQSEIDSDCDISQAWWINWKSEWHLWSSSTSNFARMSRQDWKRKTK